MPITTSLTTLRSLQSHPRSCCPSVIPRGIIFDLSRNNVWPAPFTGKCLVNDHARRWIGREIELMQNVAAVAADYVAAKTAGNFDVAAVIAGEAVGLIHDIPPAAEIVERIAVEAEQLLEGRRNSVTTVQDSLPSPGGVRDERSSLVGSLRM